MKRLKTFGLVGMLVAVVSYFTLPVSSTAFLPLGIRSRGPMHDVRIGKRRFHPCAAAVRIGTPISDASKVPRSTLNEKRSPLALEFDEIADAMGGKGRAKMVWDSLRNGIDPLDSLEDIDQDASREDRIEINSPDEGIVMGHKARKRYLNLFGGRIEDTISKVSKVLVSRDGTAKLLLNLHKDGLEVEAVIIPWPDRQTSTLCISSQVGCRQGCTFCMTGRMGRLRSLSADEILSQVFHAIALTRKPGNIAESQRPYPIDNIVFMGMGEPGDNIDAVVSVSKILVNSNQFQLAPRRVTISTVGPSPDTFLKLGQAPAVLAWSVHASRDELRKQLVPTTQYTMVELREGLIQALEQRSRRLQSIMLEVTLLDEINDGIDDANHLADFCGSISERVPHTKVVVNLIPWNDIAASSGPATLYRPPTEERLLTFKKTLVDRGLRCYVRTTRGDDEGAACGQLATTKKTMRNTNETISAR